MREVRAWSGEETSWRLPHARSGWGIDWDDTIARSARQALAVFVLLPLSGDAAVERGPSRHGRPAQLHELSPPLLPRRGVQQFDIAVCVQFHAGQHLRPKNHLLHAALNGLWRMP